MEKKQKTNLIDDNNLIESDDIEQFDALDYQGESESCENEQTNINSQSPTVEQKQGFKQVFKANLNNLLGAKPKTRNAKVLKATTRIAYTALLTALATLFNIGTLNPSRYFAISFISIPCFIAGIMLGPISGFAVGFLGDLMGFLIAPQGPYMPAIAISSGLFGLIPGVVFLVFKGHPHLKILISYVICLVICTCLMNTLNLWLVYSAGKTTFWTYLSLRLPFQIIVMLINLVLTTLLYVCLVRAKIIKYKKPQKKQKN